MDPDDSETPADLEGPEDDPTGGDESDDHDDLIVDLDQKSETDDDVDLDVTIVGTPASVELDAEIDQQGELDQDADRDGVVGGAGASLDGVVVRGEEERRPGRAEPDEQIGVVDVHGVAVADVLAEDVDRGQLDVADREVLAAGDLALDVRERGARLFGAGDARGLREDVDVAEHALGVEAGAGGCGRARDEDERHERPRVEKR